MSRRLPDIVELFSRQFREVRTFIKHPGAILRMQALKRARSAYENTELPGGQTKKESPSKDVNQSNNSSESSSRDGWDSGSLVPKFKDRTQARTLGSTVKDEIQDRVDLPYNDKGLDSMALGAFSVLPLPESSILSGSQWYKYTIGQLVRDDQWVRWYFATNQADEPVIIQEYVLPNTEFSSAAIEERQTAFVQLINLNINVLNGPGEGRDFRLLKLIEAFSPTVQYETAYCYLVAKPLPGIPLQEHLHHHGYWNSGDIREALRQVLQSLQFLHTSCRIKFSNTHMERGIPHGNLSLDSLFIRQSDLAGVNSDRRFFIHITDLLLWEHVIYPPVSPKFHSKISESSDDVADKLDDLKDLGRIGFQLAGCTVDSDQNDIVELRNGQAQTLVKDDLLYHFLCRLMGKENPIKTVDDAIEILRKLPETSSSSDSQISSESLDKTPPRNLTTPWGLPAVVLALILMGATAWLFLRNRPVSVSTTSTTPQNSKTNDQNNGQLYLASASVPQQAIRYQIESGGVWQDAMWSQLLISSANQVRGEIQSSNNSDKLIPFIAELKRRQPQLRWARSKESRFQSVRTILRFVRQSPQNVGFVRVSEIQEDAANSKKYDGLESQTLAYDGLAILVPFRDSHNVFSNVPEQLGGAISIDELKQLYTSDSLDNIKLRNKFSVQLHFPDESELVNQDTIRLFKEQILGNDDSLIRKFDHLQRDAAERDEELIDKYNLNKNDENNLNNNLYEKMLYTYEKDSETDNEVIIGFDRLSRYFGQCSVYPLALSDGGQPVQPLVQINGEPIKADVDLCDVSNNFYVDLPERYPLRYKLALVYQEDSKAGRVFWKMLSTQEVSYLLSEVGLVPANTSREGLWSFIWEREQ